jgi:tryptophan-rich sensory protein
MTPNIFTHICATADGSNVRLYQNGGLPLTYNQTVNPEFNSQNILIGKDWTNNYFPGNVALTRLYNRALSSSEVRQNFNSTKSSFGI